MRRCSEHLRDGLAHALEQGRGRLRRGGAAGEEKPSPREVRSFRWCPGRLRFEEPRLHRPRLARSPERRRHRGVARLDAARGRRGRDAAGGRSGATIELRRGRAAQPDRGGRRRGSDHHHRYARLPRYGPAGRIGLPVPGQCARGAGGRHGRSCCRGPSSCGRWGQRAGGSLSSGSTKRTSCAQTLGVYAAALAAP